MEQGQDIPHPPLQDLVGLPHGVADILSGLTDNGDTYRVDVPLTEQIRGSALPVHGGVLCTLIDVASAMVAQGGPEVWERGAVAVTTEAHIRYLRQPKIGPIRVEARIVHRGRRLVIVDCVISDGYGRKLALGSSTYMVIEGAVPTSS
jgi:uncharacterized protein (TIGR00369 family)